MNVSINGKPFDVANEPADFWGWVQNGNYNREWQTLDKYLKPEHTFVDLGAWVGSHSLYASKITKNVISVEPDPVAFDILEYNLKANGLDPAHRLAITDYEGAIELGSGFLGASTTRANRNAGGNIGAWEPGHQFTIPCITIRKFAAHITGPLFIKIDVEGSEEQIIKDYEFFREFRPVVYLSLHPFWWRNPDETWKDLDRLIALYPHTAKAHQELILA
jgi:FkbM family methyltransferase